MRARRGGAARRRGSVLVMMPWILVICIAMLALMVDLGHVFTAQSRIQSAADAASLAGALQLREKRGGKRQVREMAIRFAELNHPGIQGTLRVSDVQIGIWEPVTGTFRSFPGLGLANAVRVTVRRDAQNAGGVPLLFARLFGRGEAEVSAEAIAAFRFSRGRGLPGRTLPALVQ